MKLGHLKNNIGIPISRYSDVGGVMSEKLGFHIGFSFIEAFALIGEERFEKRYFLSEFTESKAIEDFLKSLPENSIESANITTKWSERIIQKKIGTNIALLVTEGFQNWPNIRQPAFHKRFSRQPQRTESVISDDFIFGLSERTTESGEILTKPSEEEVDFLHSKLKLMGITTIALGFLHSNSNPANELWVEERFKKLGYKVLCSHKLSTKDNEVARWWRSVLDAYVVDVFGEQKSEINQILSKSNIRPKFLNNHAKSFLDEEESFFSSIFGRAHCVAENFPEEKYILYLGLEDFLLLEPGEKKPIYKSAFGPVGINHTKQTRLGIQPTQIIAPNNWKLFRFENEELGFEPGPMILGKSLTPCFLDLLYVNKQLDKFESLADMIRPNSKSRILETLYTFTRDTEYEKDMDGFIAKMRSIAYKKLALELSGLIGAGKLLVVGPLATVISPELKELMGNSKVTLGKNSAFVDAYATAITEVKDV